MAPLVVSGNNGDMPEAHTWRRYWLYHEDYFVNLRATVDANQTTTRQEGERSLRPSEGLIRERILPALHDELEPGAPADRKGAVLIALARIGEIGDRTFATLVAHLADDERAVAENASLGLGILGTPPCAPTLAELLHDSERGRELLGRSSVPDRQRALAAYGLGLCAARATISDVRRFVSFELERALEQDTTNELRSACTIALGLVPHADGSFESCGICRRLHQTYSDPERPNALRAQGASALGMHLEATEDAVRNAASKAYLDELARRRLPIAIRQSTVLALGLLADADGAETDRLVRRALIEATREGDRDARAFAILSLADIGSRRGSEGEAYEGTVEILAHLEASLATAKALERPWAALALGMLRRTLEVQSIDLPPSTGKLALLLEREKAPDTALVLGLAAGLSGTTCDTERLLELSTRKDLGSVAALGLGFLGTRTAIPVLRELLEEADHDPFRMKRMASALALAGDERLLSELIDILSRCECDLSNITLAYTLGHTGDSRAVAPLLAMLADDQASERKRSWAIYGLGVVADREALPWTARYAMRVNYLAAPPTLTSRSGTGLLEQR